jgi:putative colanic acid biosynthesis acetyltransferase WcaF
MSDPAAEPGSLATLSSAPARMPVDVFIQTFNEEINLPHTLATVMGWANRVFVVDSGSTDRTREIAREHGAEVFEHAWEGYARQKNWALANLPFESPWTLILDADEALTPELKREIDQIITKNLDEVRESGFYLNRVFIFMGKEIWHCGYFPSWNLRLFKRGSAKYEDRLVHEHMIVNGPTEYLKHWMIHEDRRGLEHFFAKHNRYSTLEAREFVETPEPWPGLRRFLTDRTARRRFGKSRMLPLLPVPWIWRLLYMYVIRLGFLDGYAGWMLCNFIGNYEFLVQAKLRELKRLGVGAAPGRSINALSVAEGEADVIRNVPDTRMTDEAPQQGNGDAARVSPVVERRGRPASSSQYVEVDPNTARLMSPWTLKQKIARALWMVTRFLLFRPSFHNWYGWRRFLLKLFGARIGARVRIRPTASIEIPWNIDIGDEAIVGDYAILYSLGKITIGKRVVISQYAHVCAGTHDYRYREFPLLKPPITIGDDAWIAADAFVAPGVTIGPGAILGARASAFNDLPAWQIAVGNPAKPIKPREPLQTLG